MEYERLKKNFEKHGFQTSCFETGDQAAAYLKESIKGEKVAFGGSITLQQLNLEQILSEDNEVMWHWSNSGKEILDTARRDASVYITSANGVAETGHLVNIDGTGNRVSMTVYGPKKTYFIVGKNKIEADMHSALMRAKNIAAPKNALRLNRKTPCAANGADRCYDCDSPDRICKATVILDRPCNGMEVEIVFVDQELGY